MPAFVTTTTDYKDDITGVDIAEKDVDTVSFSYRGHDFTLVLTKQHGSQFDKDIAPWIKAAKKAQAQLARAAKAKPAARTEKPTATDKSAPAPRKAAQARPAASARKAASADKKAPARKAAPAGKAPARKSAAARKAASPRKVAEGKATASVDERARAKAIRAWATANGHKVSERGRISASVVEAFDAAQ